MTPSTRVLYFSPGLLLALCCACNAPPTTEHVPMSEKAVSHPLAQVPHQAVSGQLRGVAFRAVDARVRVQTMSGRERVDVLLSDIPIERCGLPLASKGRRVWLRIPGTPKLDGTPFLAEVGDTSKLTVHFEQLVHHQWLGHAGGAAMLSLRDAGFGKYEGALWTCFDDAAKSCVTGRFHATSCRSELDVDDAVWGAARVSEQQRQKGGK